MRVREWAVLEYYEQYRMRQCEWGTIGNSAVL